MDIYNSTMAGPSSPVTAKANSMSETSAPAVQRSARPEPDLSRIATVEKPQDEAAVSASGSEDLNLLVDRANESFSVKSSNLKFSVVEGTNISVVRVEDSETGELIRQFPSEEMVAFVKALDEMKQGAMFEERA